MNDRTQQDEASSAVAGQMLSEAASGGVGTSVGDAALGVVTEDAPADLVDDLRFRMPQRRGFFLLFVLGWAGLAFATGSIAGAALPKFLAVLDPDGKTTTLSLVTAIGAVVVMIITPLFGRLSDRTRSPWGRRRPWMFGGIACAGLAVAVFCLVPSILGVVIAWCLGQIGFGAVNMALHALIADQVSAQTRARTVGVLGVGGSLATLIGAQVVARLPGDSPWTWFVVPGAIGLAMVALFTAALRDPVLTEQPAPLTRADLLSTYWLDPRRYRNFAWAWMCRLLVTISIATVSGYLLYFIIDNYDKSPDEASQIFANALVVFAVGNVLMAVVVGWLSDKIRRRKPIVLASSAISAGGLAMLLFSHDLTSLMVALAVVGAAQGAYVSVDVALMTEVLPDFADAGKDLGIVALSYQLPQLLIPMMAVPLLSIGGGENYTALFIAALVAGVLGGLAVVPIRGVR